MKQVKISFTPFAVYWIKEELRISFLDVMINLNFRSLFDFNFKPKSYIVLRLFYHFNFSWAYNEETKKYEW